MIVRTPAVPDQPRVERPRVLMVTGAYHPEMSGASLQCRQLIRLLRPHVDFVVLTTTMDFSLAPSDLVDDIEVWRVPVDPARIGSKAAAFVRMSAALVRLRNRFDVVHLHGFSQKTMFVIAAARTLGKPVVIKLTSVGHDDAVSMRSRGGAAFARSPIASLSDRELEVFRLIGEGSSTRRIAEALNLSVKTVESYQAHIKEKLALRNARELQHHAIEWALNGKAQS